MCWCCCVTLQHRYTNVLVLLCYTTTQIHQCVGVAVLHYNTDTAVCWCCCVTPQHRYSNVLVLLCYTSTQIQQCVGVAMLHYNADTAMYWCCCVTLQHLNSNVLVLLCYTTTQIQQCVGVAMLHLNTDIAMCWCFCVTIQHRHSESVMCWCCQTWLSVSNHEWVPPPAWPCLHTYTSRPIQTHSGRSPHFGSLSRSFVVGGATYWVSCTSVIPKFWFVSTSNLCADQKSEHDFGYIKFLSKTWNYIVLSCVD